MTASRKILIVTASHLCRNPRVVKEATTLGETGYAVTVLGIAWHPAYSAADAALLEGKPFRHVALDHFGRTHAARAAAFVRRARIWCARRINVHTPFRTLAALGPGGALYRMARRLPSDLAIVHTELAAWVGLRLLRDGRRVAVDFEDWYSEDLLPADRRHLPLAGLQAIERRLMRSATHKTTTSRALGEALAARYDADPPVVLSNAFPLQPDPRPAPAAGLPSFFWFSQTLGPGRGLEDFFAAWQRVSTPSRVVLLGEPRPDYVASLLARLPPELRSRVELRPLVPPAELPSVIAQHDIGLALEQSSIVNRDLTITNKILQYLNAGLAVVATDTRGQREVFSHAPGIGVILPQREPAAWAASLAALVSRRAALVECQRAARRLAESTYCWEREAPKLLACVARSLESTPDRVS